MSNVLNRTTKAYIGSKSTSRYPVEDWVINPDVSALISGEVPNKYWKINPDDSVVEMDQAEEDVVDSAMLASLKTVRYREIDKKTNELIAAGFSYDGHTFSASLAAQINWNALKDEEAEFTWPVEISCLDNQAYSLAQANLDAFWTAYRTFVDGHLDSGRTLKDSIYNAANKAAVDAVVDTR